MATEASIVWDDRPAELLGAVLRAGGADGMPASASGRLRAATEYLRRSRRMVAVDEAQHLGPRCLGAIKTLVNQSPGEWLLLGVPTLRRRLDLAAYEEARQLSTNRLAESVRLALERGDVERYLQHKFPTAARRELKAGAAVIRDAALRSGNWAFVRDATRIALEMAPEGTEPTAQTLAEAAGAAAARR